MMGGAYRCMASPFAIFFSRAESFSLLRLGWLICVGLLFATANLCLRQMIAFENKFSAIICQSQQSPIATAPLRSPLGFCRRSIRWWLMGMRFFSFQFSAFSFPFDWLLPPFDSGEVVFLLLAWLFSLLRLGWLVCVWAVGFTNSESGQGARDNRIE